MHRMEIGVDALSKLSDASKDYISVRSNALMDIRKDILRRRDEYVASLLSGDYEQIRYTLIATEDDGMPVMSKRNCFCAQGLVLKVAGFEFDTPQTVQEGDDEYYVSARAHKPMPYTYCDSPIDLSIPLDSWVTTEAMPGIALDLLVTPEALEKVKKSRNPKELGKEIADSVVRISGFDDRKHIPLEGIMSEWISNTRFMINGTLKFTITREAGPLHLKDEFFDNIGSIALEMPLSVFNDEARLSFEQIAKLVNYAWPIMAERSY